jgi:hypothetical protein
MSIGSASRWVRDRMCAFPGCDRDARWCAGHHVVPWWAGGPTSLDNSVLLGGWHHAEVHRKDGWVVADPLPRPP